MTVDHAPYDAVLRTGHVIAAIEAGIPDPPAGWIACGATGPAERLAMILSPAKHFYEGYQDARAGLPYRADYDTWHAFWQRSYECGRAMIACMRSERFDPPHWAEPYREPANYGPVRDWFEGRRRLFPQELLLPVGPEGNRTWL